MYLKLLINRNKKVKGNNYVWKKNKKNKMPDWYRMRKRRKNLEQNLYARMHNRFSCVWLSVTLWMRRTISKWILEKPVEGSWKKNPGKRISCVATLPKIGMNLFEFLKAWVLISNVHWSKAGIYSFLLCKITKVLLDCWSASDR